MGELAAAERRQSGVLLVEFLGTEPVGESKSQAFPFIAGYLRDRGVPWRWVICPDDRKYDRIHLLGRLSRPS